MSHIYTKTTFKNKRKYDRIKLEHINNKEKAHLIHQQSRIKHFVSIIKNSTVQNARPNGYCFGHAIRKPLPFSSRIHDDTSSFLS